MTAEVAAASLYVWQVRQRKEVWACSRRARRAAPARCGLGPDQGKVKVEAQTKVILDDAVRRQYSGRRPPNLPPLQTRLSPRGKSPFPGFGLLPSLVV